MRPHLAVRRIGIILRSIFPKVLSRLEDSDFPTGKHIDHIVPSAKLAFLHDENEQRRKEAQDWCQANHYELITVSSSDMMNEADIKAAIKRAISA
jgi:hypothetical protein